MPMLQDLRARRADILRIAAQRGATSVKVFGSAARGDETAESDIDLLVRMEPGRSLLDLGGLLMDLQQLLGRDVDVVTEGSLRPSMRSRVLREAVDL
jgi:predicted nucleotidyltransferase